ncbi:MAG: hypothetical protein ABI391_02055 [Hyphomicrobiaceae bacterium]
MNHRPLLIAALLTTLASPVTAQSIDVSDNHGGRVADYNTRWAANAARGVRVRIVGPCKSACTVLLGHIPRSRICVTPRASFGFHLAHLKTATDTLWNAYQPDIRAWINQRGGLTNNFIWMRAPDTYRFFKKC